MFQPGLAWKLSLWPGLWWLWLSSHSGQSCQWQPGPGLALAKPWLLYVKCHTIYDYNLSQSVSVSIAKSSSSLISISSQPHSSFSDSSPSFLRLSSWPSTSSLISSLSIVEGAGSWKSRLCQTAHLMICKASTMSPLRWFQHLLIVIPPCEEAHLLDTEDNMIDR